MIQAGRLIWFERTARQRSKTATDKQSSTATTEASGPKAPPVRIAGPLNVPAMICDCGVIPETIMPKIEPSAKFQPA